MKNFTAKLFLVGLFFIATSFKNKVSLGSVTLDVSYQTVMGGQATILNTDTNTYYYLNAVDTYDVVEVPYGSYVLVSASNNSCGSPLIQGVTTSSGYHDFTIDGANPSFTIYVSCY